MAETKDNPTDKPWRVVGILEGKSNFAAGCIDEVQATSLATQMNKEAELLGIKTRYKAIEKPQ